MTPEQNELIDRHRSYAFERGMLTGALLAAGLCAFFGLVLVLT